MCNLEKEISVIILTHNAPEYVKETIESLHYITQPEDLMRMEILVWDNASNEETINVVTELYQQGLIDKVFFSKENLLFAGGNNECVKLASHETKYLLLLNSDIRIVNPKWFNNLIRAKINGNYSISSYGACKNPKRADGYCYLIDKKLYQRYPLDENYQWWWSITLQQATILKNGGKILALKNHNRQLIHWGGKSGKDFTSAKGMDVNHETVLNWFSENNGKIKIRPVLQELLLLQFSRKKRSSD